MFNMFRKRKKDTRAIPVSELVKRLRMNDRAWLQGFEPYYEIAMTSAKADGRAGLEALNKSMADLIDIFRPPEAGEL